jgi:hypothetical protein
MALPATETFTNSDGTDITTHNANWVYNRSDSSTGLINTNAVRGNTTQALGVHWAGDTFSNEQYSKATVAALSAGHYLGIAARMASGSTRTFYHHTSDGTDSIYFEKYIGGTITSFEEYTGADYAVNDVISIECFGTTITPKRNASTSNMPTAVTDSSITSGYAGFILSGTSTSARLDTWEGGNLAATLEQEGYRWRADDGSESAATWLVSQDTNITRDKALNTRLRVLINATGDPASQRYKLRYRKVGDDGWRDLK